MMADYRKMYYLLFNETTKAIELLQNAQRNAEEIFINDSDMAKEIKKSPAKLTSTEDSQP